MAERKGKEPPHNTRHGSYHGGGVMERLFLSSGKRNTAIERRKRCRRSPRRWKSGSRTGKTIEKPSGRNQAKPPSAGKTAPAPKDNISDRGREGRGRTKGPRRRRGKYGKPRQWGGRQAYREEKRKEEASRRPDRLRIKAALSEGTGRPDLGSPSS